METTLAKGFAGKETEMGEWQDGEDGVQDGRNLGSFERLLL